MAGELTVAQANGIQKRVYDKSGLQNSLPGTSILQRKIGWEKGSRNVGESYQVGVVLQPPNGFTYSGSAGGITTLKQARNMIMKQASIVPFELDLREQLAWALLSRAAEAGEGAMAQITGEVLKAMKFSSANRLELQILNGQRSLGTVDVVTDLGGNLATVSITAATWRPGLWWAVGTNSTFDSFTSTTLNNGTGPLILKALDIPNKTLTFQYSGAIATECASGDVLYFEGAWDGTTYNECPGLIAQASNTSGTSLGLSASTYPNWAGNTYAVSGPLNWEVFEDAISQLRDRKPEGTLTGYVANKRYAALVNELKAMRVIDSSYNPAKGKTGYRSIAFDTEKYGEIELINHPFMSQSEFLLNNDDDCARVGSSDLTFGVPGSGIDAPVWERVANSNAAEVVLFSDQCVVNKKPSGAMLGTGITD